MTASGNKNKGSKYKRAQEFFSSEELKDAMPDKDIKTSRLPFGLSKKKFALIIAAAVVVIAVLVFLLVPGLKKKVIQTAMKSDLGAAIAADVIGDGYAKNVFDKKFDRSKVHINNGVSTPKGYKVVALFGVDARGEDIRQGSRADTMMLVTINEETGEIKLGSVYRDTYLVCDTNDTDEYYIGKANAAYAIGGPEGALSMLNRNWDLAVTDYVVVNFGGMANIVDALGGVTLEVTKEEVEEINYHMGGQIDAYGGKYVPVKKAGKVDLNGAQATAFCRIRSVDFKNPMDGKTYEIDYGRTARQRYAIYTLLEQARENGVSDLVRAVNEICDNNVGDNKFILSSLPFEEFVKIMGVLLDLNIVGQSAFPNTDRAYITALDSGLTVVADTLEKNMQLLHEFLYGRKNYKGSEDFYKYDSWITSWINVQKTGDPNVMFDPATSGENYGTLDTYIPDEDDENFTFEYIKIKENQEQTALQPETQKQNEQPVTAAPVVTTQPYVEPETQPYVEPETQPYVEPETQPYVEPETQPPEEPVTQAEPDVPDPGPEVETEG